MMTPIHSKGKIHSCLIKATFIALFPDILYIALYYNKILIKTIRCNNQSHPIMHRCLPKHPFLLPDGRPRASLTWHAKMISKTVAFL